MSSKGQVVIPAYIRRELGLKTGRVLRLTRTSPREIVLSVPEERPVSREALDEMLKRSRAWKGDEDLVEKLHQMRQKEREEEVRRRERRGY
ncbi:MAG: AbrB/MazE/SpoVT family DNA-binding domain-containing protein [Myxococcaceae bacterium]